MSWVPSGRRRLGPAPHAPHHDPRRIARRARDAARHRAVTPRRSACTIANTAPTTSTAPTSSSVGQRLAQHQRAERERDHRVHVLVRDDGRDRQVRERVAVRGQGRRAGHDQIDERQRRAQGDVARALADDEPGDGHGGARGEHLHRRRGPQARHRRQAAAVERRRRPQRRGAEHQQHPRHRCARAAGRARSAARRCRRSRSRRRAASSAAAARRPGRRQMQTVIDVVEASTAAMFDGTCTSATVSRPGPPTSSQMPSTALPATSRRVGRARSASGSRMRPASRTAARPRAGAGSTRRRSGSRGTWSPRRCTGAPLRPRSGLPSGKSSVPPPEPCVCYVLQREPSRAGKGTGPMIPQQPEQPLVRC